jgi:hypothetical protein
MPVLSSSWGAPWLAPAATGEGGYVTSQQGSIQTEFPAILGLHRTKKRTLAQNWSKSDVFA